jgi:hypothetical protein
MYRSTNLAGISCRNTLKEESQAIPIIENKVRKKTSSDSLQTIFSMKSFGNTLRNCGLRVLSWLLVVASAEQNELKTFTLN